MTSLLQLTLANDSTLAIIYARAGLRQAAYFAKEAATAAFRMTPALRA